MKTFEQVFVRQTFHGFPKIDERLLDILGDFGERVGVAEAGDAEDVEDQHAMISRDGAAAFGNDDGMRHLCFVADVLNMMHDVVGVLLQGVIDARLEVGLRAVVIDAEAAADVHIIEARAGALQLDIDARGFNDGCFDLPDVGDLAAEMEVQRLEAILHAESL